MVAGLNNIDKSYKSNNNARQGRRNEAWTVAQATELDSAEIKALFWKLHAFNSTLDHRFALSEDWEKSFEEHLVTILEGKKAACLLARGTGSGRACGMLIIALHQDGALWRYREWAEVEALYIEKDWWGSGLADELLKTASEWALERGQTVVQLYVTATNGRAIHFYHREGFRQIQAILRKVLN